MKSLVKTLIISISVLGFVSCMSNEPIVSSAPVNNQTYQVDYLFEHEGCKVYRFQDRGNYVYFTNCTGDVTSMVNDSTVVRTINQTKVQPTK